MWPICLFETRKNKETYQDAEIKKKDENIDGESYYIYNEGIACKTNDY